MLGQVQPTPYDLRFELLRVPVIVSPWFWAGAAVFGWQVANWEPGRLANLLAWTVCMLVSLLLHEFGHALTMRRFGQQPFVVLYHLGGYAQGTRLETPGRSLLISAAGPAVQLLFFAAVFAACVSVAGGADAWRLLGRGDVWRSADDGSWLGPDSVALRLLAANAKLEFGTPAFTAVYSLLFINLWWPLVNLLPVWPLDGGQIFNAAFGMTRLRRPMDLTLKIGMLVGGVAAALAFVNKQTYVGIFFALLAVQNYQRLQAQRNGSFF